MSGIARIREGGSVRTGILAVSVAAARAAAAEEKAKVDTLCNDEEDHDDDEEHGGEDREAARGRSVALIRWREARTES